MEREGRKERGLGERGMRDTESGFECERKERWRVGFGGGGYFFCRGSKWVGAAAFLPAVNP